MLNTYKAYGWKLREKEGGHIKADRQALKAPSPCSKFCFDHNDNLHPPILRMQLIINLLNVKQNFWEVSCTRVWSRWKRCLFPGQGGLFLDQCRLARRRLGTCLALHTMPHLQRSRCKTMTSHQTLIARPDNSCGKGGSIKRWPENDGEDGGGDCPASLICVSLTSSYWFS